MKNILLLLLLLCFSANILSAQFGIKGGVNASNITTDNDDIEEIKARMGYQFGVMVEIPLSETIWVKPEAIFTRKGADYEILNTEIESKMNYLDIPITIAYRPKLLPIGFHFGPQFSYLLQTQVEYTSSFPGSLVIKDTDRDNFEDFDLGIALGATLQINNAFLELRYNQSLRDYEKRTTVGTLEIEPASKHFNLQMSLGYYF